MSKTYLRFPNFKLKALTLSYDDGSRQDKRLIEIMKKNGIKGTFNINSGLFSSEYAGVEKGRMSVDEALDLYASSGMEVAVHGYYHLSLARVDKSVATNDVITDRKELEKIFGKIIKGMAYANGSYNDEVVSILENCGINYSRTVISTENFDMPNDWLRLPATCHHNNPRLMELAKTFVELDYKSYYWQNSPKLFYLWGHSYEFDTNDNWNVIENFCEYMGNRDDIWYATNGEIYDYVKAVDSLEFSADASMVKNPSSIDVYIDYLNKQHVIRAGETIKL